MKTPRSTALAPCEIVFLPVLVNTAASGAAHAPRAKARWKKTPAKGIDQTALWKQFYRAVFA